MAEGTLTAGHGGGVEGRARLLVIVLVLDVRAVGGAGGGVRVALPGHVVAT